MSTPSQPQEITPPPPSSNQDEEHYLSLLQTQEKLSAIELFYAQEIVHIRAARQEIEELQQKTSRFVERMKESRRRVEEMREIGDGVKEWREGEEEGGGEGELEEGEGVVELLVDGDWDGLEEFLQFLDGRVGKLVIDEAKGDGTVERGSVAETQGEESIEVSELELESALEEDPLEESKEEEAVEKEVRDEEAMKSPHVEKEEVFGSAASSLSAPTDSCGMH